MIINIHHFHLQKIICYSQKTTVIYWLLYDYFRNTFTQNGHVVMISPTLKGFYVASLENKFCKRTNQ